MSRLTKRERTIVRNLIDYVPGEPVSAQSVVEEYANYVFTKLPETNPKGWELSPLTATVKALREATAQQIIKLKGGKPIEEAIFINYCLDLYKKGQPVTVRSPGSFPVCAVDESLRNLIYSLEEHGEILEEDMP